jgi:2-polyprenyl-3-methyl-5-hydroxy-6-metoxy-1,4-benzoquinol methylase
VSCYDCGFKFTNPRPTDENIGAFYKSQDYVSHTNTNKGFVNKLYHLVRKYTLRKKLNILNKFVSRGTILDFGCGTGMFLSCCKNDGWNTVGFEPDTGAKNIAISKGNKIYSEFNDLVDSTEAVKFDVISLWHVLEHVSDLPKTLQYFNTHLKPGGVLVIAVPNYKSYDAQYYKEFWAAYDVPRHLYHFDVDTISQLLSNNGFYLVDSLPMSFDSFYVSMLSEKYKTGAINYLKAFYIGLKSNLISKDNNSYSSTVYIFKHK